MLKGSQTKQKSKTMIKKDYLTGMCLMIITTGIFAARMASDYAIKAKIA